jgi:hypothetical protein
VRQTAVVLALVLAGCGSGRSTNAPRAGETFAVTDDELVAYTRWQREYVDLLRQHSEELDAVDKNDPSLIMRDPKALEAQVAAVVARQAPVMKAHLDRVPLSGEKADFVREATGGFFHFGRGHELVIARDDVRLDAARRRFGQKAIDDIVAREPLILEALREP